MDILFITEAGRTAGLGHLSRCLALSKAFGAAGAIPRIIVRTEPDYRIPEDLRQANVETLHEFDETALARLIERRHPAVLVVDRHRPPAFVFHLAAEHRVLSVALSVVGGTNHLADMLVNPLAEPDPSHPACRVVNDASAYLYDLGRFAGLPAPPGPRDYVLVTLGGSSVMAETYRNLLEAAKGAQGPPRVFYIKDSATRQTLAADHPDIRLTDRDHSRYLRHARFVVCNYGSTLWEALAMGKPCYVFPLSAQHQAHARKLNDGSYEIADPDDPEKAEKALDWLTALSSDRERYDRVSKALKGRFSPDAVERLCREIITTCTDRYPHVP